MKIYKENNKEDSNPLITWFQGKEHKEWENPKNQLGRHIHQNMISFKKELLEKGIIHRKLKKHCLGQREANHSHLAVEENILHLLECHLWILSQNQDLLLVLKHICLEKILSMECQDHTPKDFYFVKFQKDAWKQKKFKF